MLSLRKTSRVAVFIAIGLLTRTALGSGTSVGNGGDPLFHFLETTRNALVSTYAILIQDPQAQQGFCQELPDLSRTQIALCRKFALSVGAQIITLNQGTGKTRFVLREQPLMVVGPDGKEMPVAARTALGPQGEIEFHRPTIENYVPAQMLFLIAHEFGHKAIYENQSIDDNDPIGDFATGRELLDSVAQAVVDLSQDRGKIGKTFSLRDRFRCEAYFPGSTFPNLGVTASSQRYFFGKGFDRYETGVSRDPDDVQFDVGESATSSLLFRVRINEDRGCRPDAGPDDRITRLEVVRTHPPLADGSIPPEEILASQDLPGLNPLCEDKPRWLELDAQGIRFRCQYLGSQGTTSPALKSTP